MRFRGDTTLPSPLFERQLQCRARVSLAQHGTFAASVSHGQRKGYTKDVQETWFGGLPFAGVRRSDKTQSFEGTVTDSGSDRIRPRL